MAKVPNGKGHGEANEGASHSKDAKVADIVTGSKTLSEAKDYSLGYPDTMQHHINKGARVKG